MNLRPEVTVSFSKKPQNRKDDNPPVDALGVDLEAVGLKAAIIQETSQTVVKSIIAGYAFKKLIDTTCEIAILIAKAKL